MFHAKRIPFHCLPLLSIILITGCNETLKNKAKVSITPDTISSGVVSDQHFSNNSLDWVGTYSGTIPCADCQGIETEIVLTSANTYIIKTIYLGKERKLYEASGSLSWNVERNTITLTEIKIGPTQYFVGENKLIQLDISGYKITGNSADKYILLKIK